MRIAEALTGAQLRAQLAENAISVGKMAAALSHEINSPLGALRSSIETLLLSPIGMIDAPPEQRERLPDTRDELRRSIDESAARIDDVTRRLRRFVNLEEAEVKSADLNELLSDVTVLHRERTASRRTSQLEFDLEKSLPPLNCRPQLLTAAFSSTPEQRHPRGERRRPDRDPDARARTARSKSPSGTTAAACRRKRRTRSSIRASRWRMAGCRAATGVCSIHGRSCTSTAATSGWKPRRAGHRDARYAAGCLMYVNTRRLGNRCVSFGQVKSVLIVQPK